MALPDCLGLGTLAPQSRLSHNLQGGASSRNSSDRLATRLPFVNPWDSRAWDPRTWGLKNADQKHPSQHVEYRMSQFQVRVSCGRCSECQLVAGTPRASSSGCAATMDKRRSICPLSFSAKLLCVLFFFFKFVCFSPSLSSSLSLSLKKNSWKHFLPITVSGSSGPGGAAADAQ